MPWDKLLAAIKPHYPQAGKGRVPYPLESILRVHCVQLFYNLSVQVWKICSMRLGACGALPVPSHHGASHDHHCQLPSPVGTSWTGQGAV